VRAATNLSARTHPTVFNVKSSRADLETFDTYNQAWAYAQTLGCEFDIEFIPHHLGPQFSNTQPTLIEQSDS
jgi:hypothetical protein